MKKKQKIYTSRKLKNKFEGKGEVGGDREEEAASEPLGQEVEVEVAERAELVRQHTGR